MNDSAKIVRLVVSHLSAFLCGVVACGNLVVLYGFNDEYEASLANVFICIGLLLFSTIWGAKVLNR